MFEAIITLCLASAPDHCRDWLIPQAGAPTEAACMAQASGLAPPERMRADGVALCQEAPPGLLMQEVAPGIFVHRGAVAEPGPENEGGVANLGVIIGESSVAVIDAGGSRTVAEDLWRAIRARTDLPVRHLILTHMHPDHVMGAGFFAEAGAEVIGHVGLDRALADRADNYAESLSAAIGPAFLGSGAAPVDIPVEGMVEIDLGGRMLEVRARPLAHTGTDVTVFDRATATLFAGDLLFDDHAPALDGSLRGWRALLKVMGGEAAARIVPGHGGPVLDWPEGGAALIRYLDVLARDTRAALDDGLRLGEAVEIIGASEAGNWALFDLYNPRNATVAFTELEWE
ncbi:quinoprotein relay system zinc metallohydrolase 2 [Poseidonocella pacifica]|uniref:Quinoprotein relay system zinc metallohydrolase 2 n=1 Tax=Poseidonocella pacifica TaxID=871651 RepID=A0A1I0YGJ9_9RHOB|nr:quinoprotein relay system zinc metallohydrolase 2 [Poseidonocella pacifica]SFB12341.1 quinoprotein relay system zinc metallohydrolase 2 [Poseidonocella pacifica]